jgi:hypothetical protein
MPYVTRTNPESGKKEETFKGAFEYFLNKGAAADVGETPLRFGEIFPPLPAGKRDGAEKEEREYRIITPGSLEIWKDPGKQARIVMSAAPGNFDALAREIQATYPGAQVLPIGAAEPDWVKSARALMAKGYAAYFFDFEQAHSFPFLLFDTSQPQTLVENLLSALNARAGWVQIVWKSYDWTREAEAASTLLQKVLEEIEQGVDVVTGVTTTTMGEFPVPSGFAKEHRPHPAQGSFYHKNGQRVAKEAIEKAHSQSLIVSVRGVILSREKEVDLGGVFSSVRPSFDVIYPYFYESSLMLRWLRSREIPDPTVFLQNYAAGGFLHNWGKGREMVPVFCVTPAELPLFVNLPQSATLAKYVHYVRSSGIPEFGQAEGAEEKEGVVIAE